MDDNRVQWGRRAMQQADKAQFMRSVTDYGTHVSICKKCLATVVDTLAESDLEDKERGHICIADAVVDRKTH